MHYLATDNRSYKDRSSLCERGFGRMGPPLCSKGCLGKWPVGNELVTLRSCGPRSGHQWTGCGNLHLGTYGGWPCVQLRVGEVLGGRSHPRRWWEYVWRMALHSMWSSYWILPIPIGYYNPFANTFNSYWYSPTTYTGVASILVKV